MPCVTKELRVASVEKVSCRLIPYLLELEPFKLCCVSYFLNQGDDREERISFLIDCYSDWALNDFPIYQLIRWYDRAKTQKKRDKYRSFFSRVLSLDFLKFNSTKNYD
jgi:hypothetical protein